MSRAISEVVLERQAVGDLEQDEQVDQREPDEQAQGAVGPARQRQADVNRHGPEEEGDADEAKPARQLEKPEDGQQEADAEQGAAGGRQLQREGPEEKLDAGDEPPV